MGNPVTVQPLYEGSTPSPTAILSLELGAWNLKPGLSD